MVSQNVKAMLRHLRIFVIILPIILNNFGGFAVTRTRVQEERSALFTPLDQLLRRFGGLITTRRTTCADNTGRTGKCVAGACAGSIIQGVCSNADICCSDAVACGGNIKKNDAIIINPGFPSSYTGPNCQYTIQKLNDNICQMRVDMEKLELAPPSKDNSKCVDDTFTFTHSGGTNPPTLCGKNDGKHMYLHMQKGPGSATINIATQSIADKVDRVWKLKVSQISCSSPSRAPPSCTQFFTTHSGVVESYNFKKEFGSHHIGSLFYLVCIKQMPGFCSIAYTSDHFGVSGNASDTAIPEPMAGETNCTSDFVAIETQDKADIVGTSRYCGTGFDALTTYATPFQIRVVTDDEEKPEVDGENRGFSLKYNQLPC